MSEQEKIQTADDRPQMANPIPEDDGMAEGHGISIPEACRELGDEAEFVHPADLADHLENLTLDHEEAFDGAPLIINYTDVTVKGTLGLITGDNSWYGINLDNKSGAASIEFAEGSSVALTDNSADKDKDVIQIFQYNINIGIRFV